MAGEASPQNHPHLGPLPEGEEDILHNLHDMTQVQAIAEAILEGFDRHFRLFREVSAGAQERFEQADWPGGAEANRERIQMYDLRVKESVDTLIERFPEAQTNDRLWPEIKLAYLSLLYEHLQPELAETFFNSVACRVLHRDYYHNRYIFWRSAISTVLIEGGAPYYRCYYPHNKGLRRVLLDCVTDFGLRRPFGTLRHDIRCVMTAVAEYFPAAGQARPNFQIQVLSSLFFRNKAAYIVGRALNVTDVFPFAIAILQNSRGELYLDTIITDTSLLQTLFSFSRGLFHGRYGCSVGLCVISGNGSAGQAGIRDLQHAGAAEAG